jgi:hypothetical protein
VPQEQWSGFQTDMFSAAKLLPTISIVIIKIVGDSVTKTINLQRQHLNHIEVYYKADQ